MSQQTFLPDSLPKAKLSTNVTSNRHPIHRWFNFIAGFSPEFVNTCIKGAQLGEGARLIDPFAGLSTTLVEANFLGISSVGFESHPFFYDISLSKLFPPTDQRNVNKIELMLRTVQPYNGPLNKLWSESATAFLTKLVDDQDLRLLASGVLLEDQIAPTEQPLYRLIVSRALELTAHSQTDGIYKAPTSGKSTLRYDEAIVKICSEIKADICAVENSYRRDAVLYAMGAENMCPLEDNSCSICITSPPYLNNFDFAEMTRMELYFWRYAGSWKEITERVRRQLIVNTTTAPTDLKRKQKEFSQVLSPQFRETLSTLVDALEEQRRLRPGKKDYHLLVYPYFAQMKAIFRELSRVLRPQSPFHLVVADAALYGVHIQTEKLLADLMREAGFVVLKIEQLRTRGDRWVLEKRQGPPTSLGDFHIHARRL